MSDSLAAPIGRRHGVVHADLSRGSSRLLKDDGPVPVYENAVFEVPPDGAGEDPPFDLAAEAHEVFDRVAMGDVGDVLMDDGPSVEFLGHVVGSSADRLYAPLVRRL
jgi:hypothetical protein